MAYEDYSKLNFTQGYSGFGNSYIPSWNANSQWNNFSNLNSTFGWNGTNSFSNWGTPTLGESAFNQVPAGSSASSVNTANLSPDEIEALQRKERAVKSDKIRAYMEQKVEAQEVIDEINKEKNELEKNKNADGSAILSMSAKEYAETFSWWERAGRAAGNILQGTFKMAKSLVGYDENDNWDPIKCLKNVGIVAAGVALTAVCPAAGPVLLYSGLAMGAAQVGKGIYKACTADNVKEIDNAWQDVGVGAATAVASRGGLKGMGKAANVEMSGLKMFTNAKQLISAQKSNIFAAGFKGSGSRFMQNLGDMNPLQSKTKKDLNNAKKEHADINEKLNNPSLSQSEADALLNRRVQLEAEMPNLEAARMKELVNSPLKWLSPENRTAVRNYTGKGLFKSYWEANTAGKGLRGKSWFVTKNLGKTALECTMPEFIIWNPLKHKAFFAPFKPTDNFLYAQNYLEEGACNEYFAADAVKHYTADQVKELSNKLALSEKEANASKKESEVNLNRLAT